MNKRTRPAHYYIDNMPNYAVDSDDIKQEIELQKLLNQTIDDGLIPDNPRRSAKRNIHNIARDMSRAEYKRQRRTLTNVFNNPDVGFYG